MTRKELIQKIANKARVSQKDTQIVLNTLEEIITNNLKKGKEIKLHIGKIQVKTQAATNRFNIGSGQVEQFPETKVIRFKPAINLKNTIKNQ